MTPGMALVTGASSGIGMELARRFVDDGFVVVVAADVPAIHEVADELSAGGGTVVPVQTDLSRPEGVEELNRVVEEQPEVLTAVVLNAGVGANGRIDDLPLDDDLRVIDLNVRSSVHLAKLTVPGLVHRGAGRVLFTSSIAADAPGPYHATYAASKAFLHSYAEALTTELRSTGVTVTSLKPGPTDTAFFDRADMHDTKIGQGPKDTPADVAHDAYEAMMSGKDQVVAGSRKKLLQSVVSTVLPDRIAALVASRQVKPGSGDQPVDGAKTAGRS